MMGRSSSRWQHANSFLLTVAVISLSAVNLNAASGQWFSAWAAPPSVRFATPMSGTSVRMIVRPTISGNAVRVRLENRVGKSPVVFSAAFIGQVQSGAALVTGSNTELTFSGKPGLTLAPGAGQTSDALTLPIVAFTRYAISLDVTTAPDISAHNLGLVVPPALAGKGEVDVMVIVNRKTANTVRVAFQ